jgi:NAD(P)-dependent dehydrogenase (short-subunit alcohol dehydrogenase family)
VVPLRVLVTGASSGIGAAVSALLASRGCRVVGSGRRLEGLTVAPGGSFEAAVVADLTAPGSAAGVVEKAVATLGGLDVVVSCAGAGWEGPFTTMPPAEIDNLLDINLRAPLHLARAAAPYLLASGGQLVLVGSIAGLVGVPKEVAYGTAKAGLRGLADGLRIEWSCEDNLGTSSSARPTVTLVSPGAVATPFFSRRNRPYTHSWPHPMPVAKVARRIVRAIDRRQEDVVVPAWLGLAVRLNGGLPRLYRALATFPWHMQHLPSG